MVLVESTATLAGLRVETEGMPEMEDRRRFGMGRCEPREEDGLAGVADGSGRRDWRGLVDVDAEVEEVDPNPKRLRGGASAGEIDAREAG